LAGSDGMGNRVRSRDDVAESSTLGCVSGMSAGAPLPVDLWGSLPREARALILALREEAAVLRALRSATPK
jgi:hypothetical protein